MTEYIEREKAIQSMADNFRQGCSDGCDHPCYQIAEDTLIDLPVADVAYTAMPLLVMSIAVLPLVAAVGGTAVWAILNILSLIWR